MNDWLPLRTRRNTTRKYQLKNNLPSSDIVDPTLSLPWWLLNSHISCFRISKHLALLLSPFLPSPFLLFPIIPLQCAPASAKPSAASPSDGETAGVRAEPILLKTTPRSPFRPFRHSGHRIRYIPLHLLRLSNRPCRHHSRSTCRIRQ